MKVDVKDVYGRLEKTKDPEEQVELLRQLAFMFVNTDLDRCRSVAEEIIALAEPLKHWEGLADAYHALARVAAKTIDYELAIQHMNKALGYLENSSNLTLQAKIYDGLGVIYSHMGQFELSITSSEKAIALYEEANEPLGLKANGYNNIGNSYGRMGNLEQAEIYYTKALEVVVASGNLDKTPNLRVNLAIIKGLKGEKEQAIVELKQCLSEYEQSEHKVGIAECNNNLANIYRSINRYADAMKHYVKAIAVLKDIGHKQSLADAYVGLAKVYMSLAGWHEALEQVELSEMIHQTIDHPNGKLDSLKIKAEVLKHLGRSKEAEVLEDQADSLAREFGINHEALNY